MLHGDVLGERCCHAPQQTALVEVDTGRRFSYAELDHRARVCAFIWQQHLNLEKGDRIAILSSNRVEFVDAFCAAGKTGIILVPLGTRLTPSELIWILRDCGVKAAMVSPEHAETLTRLKQDAPEIAWLPMESIPGHDGPTYAQLMASTAPFTPEEKPSPEDVYCLLYTSGTTGRPKGVMISHRQVAWNGVNTALCWQLSASDVTSVFTPLYHAGGLGAFLVPILTAGGTIVLHRHFDPEAVWHTLERERCTVVLGVPTIWKMLAEHETFHTVDLSHVKWFISGGAPLPRHLIERYRQRGVVLKQGYGLTEVGVNCFAMSSDDAWAKAGSIGKPLMFTEATVLREDGSHADPDEVGELCFRGPHVCLGYWNNPKATAEARDARGWFHTGDMARVDSEGYFTIAGRNKDMFISGGVNVYPVEVENALLQIPTIQDVAVVGIPHPTWGEVGVAFVVCATTPPPSPESLVGSLSETLAKYKIPKQFVFMDTLPRTDYGKVVKGTLRDQYLERNPKG